MNGYTVTPIDNEENIYHYDDQYDDYDQHNEHRLHDFVLIENFVDISYDHEIVNIQDIITTITPLREEENESNVNCYSKESQRNGDLISIVTLLVIIFCMIIYCFKFRHNKNSKRKKSSFFNEVKNLLDERTELYGHHCGIFAGVKSFKCITNSTKKFRDIVKKEFIEIEKNGFDDDNNLEDYSEILKEFNLFMRNIRELLEVDNDIYHYNSDDMILKCDLCDQLDGLEEMLLPVSKYLDSNYIYMICSYVHTCYIYMYLHVCMYAHICILICIYMSIYSFLF
jgi:hypothetical protein